MPPVNERKRQKTSPREAALKNLLSEKSAVLPDEDRQEYLDFTQSFVADLKPEGKAQSDLVQVISDSFWRMRRLRPLESEQFERTFEVLSYVPGSGKPAPEIDSKAKQDAEFRLLESMTDESERLQNLVHASLKQLRELQKKQRLERERQPKMPSHLASVLIH